MPPKTYSEKRFLNDILSVAVPYMPVKEMNKEIGTMVDIFILNTVENYFGIQNGLIFDAKSKDSLTEFITNPHIMVLQVFIDENNSVQIVTEVLNNEAKSILFYKISPQELTEPNSVNNLNIITLSMPAETLYLMLKQIYSPLLSEAKDLLSNDIQQNIVDLESNLRVLTQKTGSKDVILSIQDEMAYWLSISERKGSTKKDKEAAETLYDMFKDINEEIRIIQSSAMSENKTSVENIGGILDDVWRLNTFLYPQERMTHVIDIISFSICSTSRSTLSTEDLWNTDTDSQDSETLPITQCLQVVQTWLDACKSLTETYWPNYAMHPWSGKPYVSKYCVNFEARLSQISDIRSIHSQLVKLLTPKERSELRTEQMFDSFKNVNIWNCNGKNHAWEAAEAKFSAMLKPAEGKVAEKLKPRLHNTSTKQMLYEFLRYKTLISRPTVKQALSNELEIFVSLLVAMLRNIQSQLDAEDADVRMYQPSEMSIVVQQVQWAKQMEAKVFDIQTCAEKYLKNFEESSTLSTLTAAVIKELKSMCTQLHEDWSRDLQAQVNSGSLKLSLDKPVVEFSSSNNMMVVNFNPKTVSAGIEARSMAALGLPPPAVVSDALDGLSKLLHHARYLQQVASFHNTMGERMIPSTRPLMLKAALDLSALVQDQKAVYWDNEAQVANYTDKLKKAVMELESQNSYLTSQHLSIRTIVASLVETELLSKQMEWKKKLNEIRDIIDKVESNGYKNTDSWRTHWDWQLYKALECQYMKTLLSLHKHFPTVKVDLVLRGRSVKTYPPLEEIRVQHYHQLRRFISLPTQFVGLQTAVKDGSSIFSAIVDKHSWMGNKSVTQIESTLSSLERVCDDWTRRAALACVVDLEQMCKDNLKEPKDWEINFKACKAYGQAVAKINFEDEKIEWITVGTAGLRREFEAQVRNLWSALISSLQSNCRDDSATLDSFMANAMLTLENKAMPKNAKELAEISAKQQTLRDKMPEMEKLVEDLKQKGHMLRTWGGDPSVNNTLKEWQKIHELMLTNQQLFEHQAEIVKSSLTGELDNINTSLEAWYSRWCQNRSRYEDTRNVAYEDMVLRCESVYDAQAQLDKFVSDRDDLLKESEKFNLKPNIPKTWSEALVTITEDILLWTPLKEYNEEYTALAEQEWIVFQKKLHLLDELVAKWVAKLEPFTTVTLFLQQELMKYSEITPLLKYLRGTDFTEIHWREIYSLLEMECKKPDTLLVKDLLKVSLNIKKHIKSLQKISATASSESAIRSTLNELELWYAGARIAVVYYKDKAQQPIPIVKDFKDIMAKIEEQQWAVTSARGSGSGDATTAWEARLRNALTLLRSLHHAQRRWLYLEPILSSDDGELGTKFRKVDLGFKQVARTVESDPRLSALLQSMRLQPMLDSILEQLHACQSALNQYIDDKRAIFPRLYFLSDDDLLELLGQARAGSEGRELVMQNHLKKLFPGITGVKLGPNGMSITALCSLFDEVLQLEHPVDIDCPVELWLKNLETEMRTSLKTVTLKYLTTNSTNQQDPLSLPTQVICLVQNIRFTDQLEKAIATKELHKLKSNIENENKFYMEYDVVDDNERSKRQALILQCAHYVSVIKSLIENNVSSASHWLWQKELRFYVIGNKEIVARMGMAEISYSYEYLGVNTGQFVRTELADECFLILTQALHLGLVGNPFGPAGTGKTESVKALGGLVGRLVLVFNCDEAMDAKCMSRLLTGLSLSGAWGCFDELNRLSADTLAEVSHQFSAVMQRDNVVLDQKQITVSPWCSIAATMNPVGRGYGGRRALPAALERTLMPVALTSPKGDELARHLLYARAVENAEVLAEDLYTVFDMAGELLTGERHYDWGLRALKAAVGSCGVALSSPNSPKTLAAQKAVLRKVLTLNNLSKLTRHDALRFEEILSMVFPDVTQEAVASNPIVTMLDNSVKNLELVHNDLQIQKCIELYEQLQQRMGVVIVGAPGSGKTTIRHLLKDALKQQGKSVVEYVICPKAMSRKCLLGHIDHDTRQWTDGVISATALEVSNQSNDIWSWIVCDGDIDPEWIEALNSVLDDNRLLTLPSGWRIQFPNNVNFIFETHSLEHASPATITRMGIILLSDDNNCATELLEKWLCKAEVEHETAKMAVPLLGKVVKKCVNWLSQHQTDTIMKTCGVSVVQQILTQFEYVAQNVGVSVINTAPEELVYTAVQRSVMGLLKSNALDKFRDEMSEVLGMPPIQPMVAGEWIEEDLYLSNRLARSEASIRAIVASSHSHLLVIGPHASAKNTLTEYVLRNSSTSLIITLDCTPVLQPADIIMELKRHNAASTGGRGSAVKSKEVASTLFIRGLHRASIDEWGSSPVQAFLLQLIQHGGFWEQSNGGESGRGVQWCSVHRVRLVASSASTRLCPRLAGAWACCTLEEPDFEEIHELASKTLRQNVNKSVSDKEITSIVESMMTLYRQVSEEFVSQPHYTWNASDIKKWCINIKWYDTSNMDELCVAITAEADKIFQYRLVTDQEKVKYNSIVKRCLKTNSTSNNLIPKLRGAGVFLESVDERIWTQHVNKIINQCLTEQEHSVFGNNGAESCKELSVLCPVYALALNGGLVVSVSSTGMGRRAAAHIVSTALSANLVCVNHTSEFNSQFKNALSSCGTDGNRTLVLVTESAVNDLALGHIEALLKARTVQTIPRELMPSLGHAQPDASFIENIKRNLGIIINLDIDQKNLSEIIEKYPMLYKDSHLVWQQHWCDHTLRIMPKLTIERLRKETSIDGISIDGEAIPVDGFVAIHQSLSDPWMQAPCRYVNFIKTYYNIVCTKKAALLQRQTILSSGVEALRRARSEVGKLKADAAEQEIALSEKQAKANHALDQIGATVRAATDKKEEMHELKKNIEKENEILQIRKKEIEVELASVEPVIAAARAAVGDIKAESLSEVRSLRAPPDVVRDVLEGVLRLMGIADTSWHSMKSFLSKRGVKEDIRCLDASQITPEAAESVRRLLERRGASFDEKTSKRASAACAPLAAWVRANLAYVDASAKIRPLQARQRELSNNLKEAENQLEALSSGLATVDERVASLKQKLGKYTKDAAAIELRLATATQTITAASGLLEQLVDEFDAWERDLEYISKEISELSVRSLLAAAYVVYLPEYTEPEARSYINKWSTLIGFEDVTFAVINFLSNTEKQLKWDADGLPSDQSAVKNAILIDQFLESSKYGFTPLIIDPDGDAMGWLKSTLAHIQCDVISQQSAKLQTAVQYAVRLGRLLLITEVDSVHASWAPLLLGQPLGGATGRVLLYSRDTTLPKRLPSHRRAVISVLNFTARVHGLTDQLVHYALQEQNPQVNEKSREIKLKKATLQKQQHELQENLLKDLSKNNDILNDANLLASLKKTRSSTATIAESLQAARDIEAATTKACEAFESTAKRTAVLALAVKELSSHKPLIALPVDAVLDVYVDAVKQEGRISTDSNPNEVIKFVSRRLIERVLLGLHEKDKYIIVLHLLKQVYDNLVPDEHWQVFLGGIIVLEMDVDIVSDISEKYPWLHEESLKKLAAIQLNHPELFTKFSMDNTSLWNDFHTSGDLKLISKLQLSPFENVLAVAIMRPESLYRAIVFFVDQILGVGVMCKGNEIEVGTAWSGDRSLRPLLLLGSHATDHLTAHAAAKNQTLFKVYISDGAEVWQKAVEEKKSGGWVCLEVGASPFTAELTAFVTQFSQTTTSDFVADFRLWIVSEDRDIPPIISNACVNIILEPPEGIKNNVLNTLSAWGNYENSDVKLVRARACLAYLHALVQERRAYIPQGWCRYYAWGWGDVSACAQIVSQTAGTSARALCRALYAGRVRTAPDRSLTHTLHQECLGEHTLAHSWKPRGVNVQLPFGKQLQAYASALSALPNIDTPQMLGLPENCRAAWETKAAHNIVQGIKEINSIVSISKADASTSLRPLLNLWKKLMAGNPLLKGDPIPDMVLQPGWWGCVGHSEALTCARALTHIHRALAKLRANNSLTHLHKVPEDWQVLWSGPDAPELYIKELSYRANEAVRRIKHYKDNSGQFPTEIALRGLFSVRGVVAAVKAAAAHSLACSPHLLSPSVHWTNTQSDHRIGTKRSNDISITLTGLQLSGAVWESALKPGDGCNAPPIILTYVQSNNAVHLDSSHFNVPVYNNEAREEVLFYAPAPLDPGFDSALATLNAVALFVPYH